MSTAMKPLSQWSPFARASWKAMTRFAHRLTKRKAIPKDGRLGALMLSVWRDGWQIGYRAGQRSKRS